VYTAIDTDLEIRLAGVEAEFGIFAEPDIEFGMECNNAPMACGSVRQRRGHSVVKGSTGTDVSEMTTTDEFREEYTKSAKNLEYIQEDFSQYTQHESSRFNEDTSTGKRVQCVFKKITWKKETHVYPRPELTENYSDEDAS